VVDTGLTARLFLEACQDIERRQGRKRKVRWGPRTLDIDLLLFGNEVHDEPGLTVPHPRLAIRRFVLQPLVDAWPEASMPDGTSAADLLEGLAGQQVELVDDGRWWAVGDWCPGR
jgi:2-amino-4-hydroxy-6-hydroxymethyldihydropteridine diphosphokinase